MIKGTHLGRLSQDHLSADLQWDGGFGVFGFVGLQQNHQEYANAFF